MDAWHARVQEPSTYRYRATGEPMTVPHPSSSSIDRHVSMTMQHRGNRRASKTASDSYNQPCTGRPHCEFVCCRDVECAATVEHMFDQADVPERIYVGVCEQNHELPGGSEDCTTGALPYCKDTDP